MDVMSTVHFNYRSSVHRTYGVSFPVYDHSVSSDGGQTTTFLHSLILQTRRLLHKIRVDGTWLPCVQVSSEHGIKLVNKTTVLTLCDITIVIMNRMALNMIALIIRTNELNFRSLRYHSRAPVELVGTPASPCIRQQRPWRRAERRRRRVAAADTRKTAKTACWILATQRMHRWSPARGLLVRTTATPS